jgi:AcrR family transcriptional regulator
MKQTSKEKKMSLRERNRERTRQEIVATAIKLFQELGFENVSVEMICEAVGVSRATFFNYFPQKEMIFTALSEARLEFVRSFLSRHAKEPLSYKYQDIIDLFLAVTGENEREEQIVKYVLPQVFQRPACLEHAMTTRREFEAALKDLLVQINEQGKRLNDHFSLEEIAQFLISIYFSTVLEWARFDTPKGWLSETLRKRLLMAAGGIWIEGEAKNG